MSFCFRIFHLIQYFFVIEKPWSAHRTFLNKCCCCCTKWRHTANDLFFPQVELIVATSNKSAQPEMESERVKEREWGRGEVGEREEGKRVQWWVAVSLQRLTLPHWARPPHLSITSPANHFCASSFVLPSTSPPSLPPSQTASLYLYTRAETPFVVHMCCVELDSLWLVRIIRPQRVVCETPCFPSHLPSVNNVTLIRRPHLQCVDFQYCCYYYYYYYYD